MRVPEMEGRAAHWYARQRGSASQLREYPRHADRLTAGLPAGAAILEVAPGPGYLSVELARRGFAVTAVDISRTMVAITAERAAAAGVVVDVRHGDATALPFGPDRFELVVCQAAFKNFRDPVRALDEMHRVLRPGGTAVIDDLNAASTRSDIAAEVDRMGLSAANAAATRFALNQLRRRAHPVAEFERLARASTFGGCGIRTDGTAIEVRLSA